MCEANFREDGAHTVSTRVSTKSLASTCIGCTAKGRPGHSSRWTLKQQQSSTGLIAQWLPAEAQGSAIPSSRFYVRMGVIVGECMAWCDTMRPFRLALDPAWHGAWAMSHGNNQTVQTCQAVVSCGVHVSTILPARSKVRVAHLNFGRPPCPTRPPVKHCSSGACCHSIAVFMIGWLTFTYMSSCSFHMNLPALIVGW